MIWAMGFYLPIIVMFALVVKATGSPVSADVLFAAFNSVALLGTALAVDEDSAVERRYFWIVFALTSAAVLVIGVVRVAWPKAIRLTLPASATPVGIGLLSLYALASLVSVGYFAAVGHITLIEAIRSPGGYDSATARLDSYSGSTYYFPGYVNQFKNSVLPIVTAAIVHGLFVRRSTGRWPVSIILSIFAFVMVAGTGQRGAMVLAVLVLLTGLLLGRVLKGSILLGSLMAFFALFALQTVVLQRQAAELAGSSGTIDRIVVFGTALWSRAVLENPRSGIAAFHYTETLPTAWGSEWISDTVGLLPGFRGSDLSQQVFATLYGSTRGTAPPSVWGDVYYNFGLAGSLVVTSCIAVLLVWVGRATLLALSRDAQPTLLRVLAAAGIAVSAGTWIAGSPASPLNQGLLAYAAIFILEPRISRRRGRTPRIRLKPSLAQETRCSGERHPLEQEKVR